MERLFRLLKQGMRIGARLSGANMTNFDKKEKRVLSPRFLGVAADRDDDEKVNELIDIIKSAAQISTFRSIYSVHRFLVCTMRALGLKI